MSVLDPIADDEYEKWIKSLSKGVNSKAVRRLKGYMIARGWSSVANKRRTPRHAQQRERRLLVLKRKLEEGTEE